MAQQKSHVPKFGNWDGDNVPYTAFFETARKEKAGGGPVRMNPNDPEENPDAFMFSGFITGTDSPKNSISSAASLKKPGSVERVQIEGQQHHHRKNSSSDLHNHHQRNPSESSSSDKGNRDNGSQPRNLLIRKRSENKKSLAENSYSFFPHSPPPGPNRLRGGTIDDMSSYKSISVPKFGAWDERDPRSAEGFTVIFNKVKEEKQIAASKFPTVESQNSNNRSAGNQKKDSPSKMRCCLF